MKSSNSVSGGSNASTCGTAEIFSRKQILLIELRRTSDFLSENIAVAHSSLMEKILNGTPFKVKSYKTNLHIKYADTIQVFLLKAIQ
jgi:hypothetical protein